ncbi:MAG: hypothetical protein ABFS56_11600 [Pseudomonadota bacterium]
MNINLAGRVQNTHLPYQSALLPLLEAIINAIHAIEESVLPQTHKSFQTSDSSFKRAKGAKGIGRFVWLKAFKNIEVESQFQENGRYFALRGVLILC